MHQNLDSPRNKRVNHLKNLKENYRRARDHEGFYRQLLVSIGVFLAGLFANYWANIYTATRASGIVQDLILNNIPTIPLDDVYLEGFAILLLFITLLGLYRPHRLPFLLKTIGLFIGIRSFFIILTHLSVPLSATAALDYAPTNSFIKSLSSGNDLFFSGHTGLPFLLALIFWKDRLLRYLFLATSFLFGIAVLFAHVHYSIDVFGAFFITYAIYDLAVWLFTKDHKLFHRVFDKDSER